MFVADMTAWTAENIIIRMVAAIVLGAVIGIDRGAKRRGGGARTDAAVCLGAALVMMTGQYMEIRFPGASDMARLASQVVSGVGFLGAGSIIVSGHQVKGLTSASGLRWGSGLWTERFWPRLFCWADFISCRLWKNGCISIPAM